MNGNGRGIPAPQAMTASPRCLPIRSQEGFSYIGILLVVTLIGIQLGLAGVVWSFAQTRQKERELLFVGGEFRTAISQYYLNPKGSQKEYPRRLEDLIKDPRYPGTVRHLRKIYADPITGKKQWGLVKLPNGGIVGVYSLSEKEPIKTGNFRPADISFMRKQRYSDWKFVHAFGTVNVAVPGSPGTPAVPTLSSDVQIHNGEDEGE